MSFQNALLVVYGSHWLPLPSPVTLRESHGCCR